MRRETRQVTIDRLPLLALLGLFLLTGCVGQAGQVVAWPDGPRGGRIVRTEHYDLHTTLRDPALLDAMADTMERTHQLYERLAPLPDRAEAEAGGADDRMEAFIFALRDEWVDHTRETTGRQSRIYLQISRGGYAHDKSFATFYHGGPQTLSVCRHEGWHQYVANGFVRRPPAFLEEGIATLFESGFDDNDLSRPRLNAGRLSKLREAVRRQRAWPLAKLLTMDAGDVVGTDGRTIDTFYAQAWALARFLVSDDELRPGFRDLLAACASGQVAGSTSRMFETHLGIPFAEVSKRYETYVRNLVRTRP